MYDWLHRLLTMGCGLFAAWFTFYHVKQPEVPIYHSLLLFCASWILSYSFISMLFLEQPYPTEEKSKTKKVRRKKTTPAIKEA